MNNLKYKKGKSRGSIVCMRKIAASILLKLFTNGNEYNVYTIHYPSGPELYDYTMR